MPFFSKQALKIHANCLLTICMNYQSLFSLKIRKKISKCRLQIFFFFFFFLPSVRSVNFLQKKKKMDITLKFYSKVLQIRKIGRLRLMNGFVKTCFLMKQKIGRHYCQTSGNSKELGEFAIARRLAIAKKTLNLLLPDVWQ